MYDWNCDADEYREVLSRILKKSKGTLGGSRSAFFNSFFTGVG